MEKVFNFNFCGEDHKVVLRKGTYQTNNTLAIQMFEVYDDGSEEPFAIITKNVPIYSEKYCKNNNHAFIDTNNLGNSIIPWLRNNDIATCTGNLGFSGYCCYPEVQFDESLLKEMADIG